MTSLSVCLAGWFAGLPPAHLHQGICRTISRYYRLEACSSHIRVGAKTKKARRADRPGYGRSTDGEHRMEALQKDFIP